MQQAFRRAKRRRSVHFKMAHDIEATFDMQERVYVKNPEDFRNKIALMRQDGISKLNLFSDFDFTLTRRTIGSNRADNSFGVLEKVIFFY